ncbi:MAG: glutathione synthetase, partial [Allomuricauda sp.]
ITYINKVYKTKAQCKVIDFIESKVMDKLKAFDRRSRLRSEVENA